METQIVKIEENKIQVVENNDIREYELESWVKPEFVKLGLAEVTITNNKVSFVSMTQGQATDKARRNDSKKRDDIVSISGKDFMTYEGLLKKAHEKGEDFSMELTESWVSGDMKMAWCKVRLTAGKRIFDGFGSSTPENTGTMTEHHPVEMAHTRAKGRALRDYLNIGQVMAEELKDGKPDQK